jgi:hypothetical protein
MPRLELTFLHLARGGGCFKRRDEDSAYLQSEHDPPHAGSSTVCILPATLRADSKWPAKSGLNEI